MSKVLMISLMLMTPTLEEPNLDNMITPLVLLTLIPLNPLLILLI
jgi:hypothetical protein